MYQIRKCLQYNAIQSSEIISLDPNSFKNLGEYSYDGDSEEDFINYISELDMFDVYDLLDVETRDELMKINDDVEWTEIYNSAWDRESSWLEIGKKDKDYKLGFDVKYSTWNENL
jgi:hypothetical protein